MKVDCAAPRLGYQESTKGVSYRPRTSCIRLPSPERIGDDVQFHVQDVTYWNEVFEGVPDGLLQWGTINGVPTLEQWCRWLAAVG